MGELVWYVNRLKAMNPLEVLWRLKQKIIQKKEQYSFRKKRSVCDALFSSSCHSFIFDADALGINFSNISFSFCENIHLLGGYDYSTYKTRWHAGFQTKNEWERTFSYSLLYKQRDDIGDARTNWELNRHFQFSLLAKNYYASRDAIYLNELKLLFSDWNKENPFLWGISWTSVMEVAIRSISWMFALAFLERAGCEEKKILIQLQIGILNMINYITKHYSRYSSANNHLLVEMVAVGVAGFFFHCEQWQKIAIRILDKELYRQNYEDGINKELSLHYQGFVMEAYALLMHVMQSNSVNVPQKWYKQLECMCEFMSHSMCNEQVVCEFGDNDEGKILDLQGGKNNHYSYVLQFCSLVLDKNFNLYSLDRVSETVKWLFKEEEIMALIKKRRYDNHLSRTFNQGGISFLRSNDGRTLIGIDHAPLGFRSIAAHGHADALSFQIFRNGEPILIDPGTYIYHCWLSERNIFRRTDHHNTVMINNKEQSEMLGAFLWGEKACTVLMESSLDEKQDIIVAKTIGLSHIVHQRKFVFNKEVNRLEIIDSFDCDCEWEESFVVAPQFGVLEEKSKIKIGTFWELLSKQGIICVEDIDVSFEYGCKISSKVIRIKGRGRGNEVTLLCNE